MVGFLIGLHSVPAPGAVIYWRRCGLSLTGASGLILAVVEGERQICHTFVVCAAMLVEHSQRIKGILCFLSISRVL